MFLKALASNYVLPSLVVVGLASAAVSPAAAQTAPEQSAASDPNTGNLTVTSSVDLTNVYMFRGIRQDDTKVMIWPAVDLGLAVFAGDAGLKSAAINFGGGVSLGTTYTAYTSPNAGFTNVKEVMFKLGVDDSAKLGKAALKPYGIVAVEFDTAPGVGQADGGLKAGRYLEVGIGPGWSGANASVAFPIKVGMSLANYYELAGVDHKFGYFSIAGIGTVPLKGIPANFGVWNIHGGVEFQQLGDTTKAFNNDDAQKVIVSGGLGLSY